MKTRQEAEKSHELKVGLMILIGIIILVFAILSVGEQQGILSDRYKLRVLMSRVNGLQTGAPVRLAGVRVGSVIGVQFASDLDDQKIEVILEIDKKVQQRIREDSEAHIGTLGLLGDKYIGLTIGSLDQPMLNHNDLLKSADPVDLEKLIDEGVEVVKSLKKASIELTEISEKINKGDGTIALLLNDPRFYFDIDRLFRLVELLGKQINEGQGALNMLLSDSVFTQNLAHSVENVKIVTDSLRTGQGSANRLVMDPRLYNDLHAAVSRMNKVIEKVDQGDGSLGQAINDKALYQDMIRVTTELDSLVKDIRKNPQRYLKVEIF